MAWVGRIERESHQLGPVFGPIARERVCNPARIAGCAFPEPVLARSRPARDGGWALVRVCLLTTIDAVIEVGLTDDLGVARSQSRSRRCWYSRGTLVRVAI
jgi:hypothetical protein